MPPDFEELDYQETPLGTLILRRRRLRSLDNLEVYEIILGEGYLMSSLFTTVEIALANLALALLPAEKKELSVAVGGLGLGYTAHAALKDSRVSELVVVEALPAVIGWHQRELVPLGKEIHADPRCRLIEGDFFSSHMATHPSEARPPGRPGPRDDLGSDGVQRGHGFFGVPGCRGVGAACQVAVVLCGHIAVRAGRLRPPARIPADCDR